MVENKLKFQNIIEQLNVEPYNSLIFLPDLEHGYFHTAGNRMTLFGDKSRWAFAFEKTGYANREGRVSIEINYFGNCLINLDRTGYNRMNVTNSKYFSLIDDNLISEISDGFGNINLNASDIKVRGREITIEHNIEIYREKNIIDENTNVIDIVSLTRLLDETYPKLFRASEEELRTSLPIDLPKIMTIDEWHQPSLYNDLKNQPLGEHEAYQQIASVLASLDPNQ
jgi:hypothetical protein